MSVVIRGLFWRSFGLAGALAAVIGSPAVARAQVAKPSTDAATLPVRLYMRADGQLLTFAVRDVASHGAPSFCVAPCSAPVAVGHYELRLNGVVAAPAFGVLRKGTLEGHYHSREASRAGGWLALNLGGIVGGVFLTVGALGGPSWAYVAGGGTLAAAGVVFLVSYRPDTASVSFTPGDPPDVRGLPLPESPSAMGGSFAEPDRLRFGSAQRALGFRLVF